MLRDCGKRSMKSLDTNVLLYALNEDCPEHSHARNILEQIQDEPQLWIFSDQVFYELYGAIRNPSVLSRPRSAQEAANIVDFLRNKTGCLHCSPDTRLWPKIFHKLSEKTFSRHRTFDAVLAYTLIQNNVHTFYTRNTKDFEDFGFVKLLNPIPEN